MANVLQLAEIPEIEDDTLELQKMRTEELVAGITQ